MPPETKIVEESQIDSVLDTRIRERLCICFPWHKHYYEKLRPWHGITPIFTVLVENDSGIIAHAAVVDTFVRAGTEQIRVAGLQNVFVMPEFRKKGFSDIVLQAAMAEASKDNFDVGLLFTSYDPVLKVYERNGWVEIKGQEFYKIEAGREVAFPADKHRMYYPLRRKDFPAGAVHLPCNDW